MDQEKIKLSDDHSKVFDQLEGEGRALQATMAAFVAEFQKRQQDLQTRAQRHWHSIASEHGINIRDMWQYAEGHLTRHMPTPNAPMPPVADTAMVGKINQATHANENDQTNQQPAETAPERVGLPKSE